MIDDAPPPLAVRGKPAILTRPLVAIVGSRNASAAGVKFAERLTRDLGEAGFGIVSGLARDIDAAAHRASLFSGTIAVLAGGHARIYPSDHVDLLEKVLDEGAAASEMPLNWEPRARLSTPQPADLGAVARRHHYRGGAPFLLADHGAARRRSG
jgi:DNA processing protein